MHLNSLIHNKTLYQCQTSTDLTNKVIILLLALQALNQFLHRNCSAIFDIGNDHIANYAKIKKSSCSSKYQNLLINYLYTKFFCVKFMRGTGQTCTETLLSPTRDPIESRVHCTQLPNASPLKMAGCR